MYKSHCGNNRSGENEVNVARETAGQSFLASMISRVNWSFLSLTLAYGAVLLGYAIETQAQPAPQEFSGTPLSQRAQQVFWTHLHSGNYDALPEVLEILMAAYLENPNDPQITLLLAHSHLWTIAESSRIKKQNPLISDQLILADKYFKKAYQLNPRDYRIPSWLGGAQFSLGGIHQEETLAFEGYAMLQNAIRLFPEFSYFGAGFNMSMLPAADPKFSQGLEHMWSNLDICAGTKVNRKNPGFKPFLSLETTEGPGRVCWNSRIAPHNFEGFFMAMGDMLVKNGEAHTAKKVYQNAKLSKTYSSWKYRSTLKNRIEQAEESAHLFQIFSNDPQKQPEMMFNSAYACVACHDASLSTGGARVNRYGSVH